MSTLAVASTSLFRRTERPVLPSVSSSPVLRCRADQGLEIATGIKTWRDLSGNGNHLVQATGTKQPLLTASAVNGKPGLLFDGVDDFMTVAFTSNQPTTVFIVYKSVVIGATGVHDIIFDGSAAGARLVSNTIPQWFMFAGGNVVDSATVANGSYVYATCQFNSASSFLRLNGTQVASGDVGTNNPGGLSIASLAAGTRSTNIEVAEVIVYNAALSGANITSVESYLSGWYNL